MELEGLGNFLDKEKLLGYQPDFLKLQLVITETYNEIEIAKSVDAIGKDICGAVAIQLAIIGFGNKTFGHVKFADKIINIDEFFISNNISTKFILGSKLKPNELTPRRLIRFFRYSINDFIKRNLKVQSYLYKKYCAEKNEVNRLFIYPGFENIADPKEDIKKIPVLLKTYKYLDDRKGTNISEKIRRVLMARGFNVES